MRSCVGCRKKRRQSELVRIVAAGPELIPDLERRRSGRGAYLCPERPCIQQAFKRRAWGRALRAGSVGTAEEQLLERLREAFQRKVGPIDRRPASKGSATSESYGVSPSSVIWPHAKTDIVTKSPAREAQGKRHAWMVRALSEFTLTRADDMTRQPNSQAAVHAYRIVTEEHE